tara:strand:- start:1141 stop:1878 length:738 start_codon:yes stop_codon:yes gene_type:complete
MSTLRANTLKPITSGNSLVLQGDSGGSGVSGPSIDSNGDVDFTQNTDAKVKLPSGGGIYESNGSTEILTESSGEVSLKNTKIDQTSKIVSSIDTFKITESALTTAGVAITSIAYSNTFYTPVSGIVTVGSDVFSFSQTGVYIFNYVINLSDDEPSRAISFQMAHTTDGTTPTTSSSGILLSQTFTSDVGGSSPTKFFLSGSNIFNINSTNIKLLPHGATSTNDMSILSDNVLLSYFQFVKIGESI